MRPTWLHRFIRWPDNDKTVMVTDYKFQYFVSLQSKLFCFTTKLFICIFQQHGKNISTKLIYNGLVLETRF